MVGVDDWYMNHKLQGNAKELRISPTLNLLEVNILMLFHHNRFTSVLPQSPGPSLPPSLSSPGAHWRSSRTWPLIKILLFCRHRWPLPRMRRAVFPWFSQPDVISCGPIFLPPGSIKRVQQCSLGTWKHHLHGFVVSLLFLLWSPTWWLILEYDKLNSGLMTTCRIGLISAPSRQQQQPPLRYWLFFWLNWSLSPRLSLQIVVDKQHCWTVIKINLERRTAFTLLKHTKKS